MYTKNLNKIFIFGNTLLLSLSLIACGGKKSTDVTTAPVDQKAPAVNCEVWKSNQIFMSASYGLAQSKGDKIYINKLSIEQLMNSLKLESDPEMDKRKSALLDSLYHAPEHDDPQYTIEFTQGAITLRDQIAISIQTYIDNCAEQKQ